jgi:hypothetical protein
MVDRDIDVTGAALAEAAGDYVRDMAPNVSALWDAAEAALAADMAGDVTSGDAAAGLATVVAEAARVAAEAVAVDMLGATFGAVAELIAARLGAGGSDVVDVTWSDTGGDVGMVMPVAATYGDAFAVVDAWSEGPTWVVTLADMLAADVAAWA